MQIEILNRRTSPENIKRSYPDALVIDLTSKSESKFVKFSPFYPHGNIPVPFSPGVYAQSVEGIWQGLKVFENAGIDTSKFEITNMSNIKRSVRKNGSVLGHQKGLNSKELLSYFEARMNIYLPIYEFVLKTEMDSYIEEIREQSTKKKIIFLDYETNQDINDLSKPLSHAALVKLWVEKGRL